MFRLYTVQIGSFVVAVESSSPERAVVIARMYVATGEPATVF